MIVDIAPTFAASLPARGYQPVHSSGCLCPSCGRSAWLVGRTLAECAHCGTALPFAPRRSSPAAGRPKGRLLFFLGRRASAACITADATQAPAAPTAATFNPPLGVAAGAISSESGQ